MDKNQNSKQKNVSYYNSQTILRDELLRIFEKRKKSNSQKYSLSKFASELSIPRSSLSEFLSGKLSFKKRIVTDRLKDHISKRILSKFLKEHEFEQKVSFEKLDRPNNSVDIFSIDKNGNQYLNKDQEAFTRDPYCHILLVAFDLEDFHPSIDFFLSKFKLRKKEIIEKLDLMVRLGLIEKTRNFYQASGKRPKSIDYKCNKKGSQFIESLSKIYLNFVNNPKLNFSGVDRNYSHFEWFFSPLNPSDVDDFKDELRALTRRFHQKQLSSKPKKVYAFNLKLFPVEKS